MTMSLELSDGLFQLRRVVSDYADGKLQLTPQTMRSFENILVSFAMMSRKLENEISMHRWNEAARRERAAAAVVVAELTRPGTNVSLLPVIPRPAGADAQSEGARQ